MADFTLVVGADVGLSYDQMRKDLDSVVAQLNAKPLQVKVEFDKSSLQSMRSEIENIHKSIATGTTKVPVDTTGIAKITKQARQATSAVQNMNKAMGSTSDAAKSASDAERQLKKIADAATQARALLNKNMEAGGSASYQKLNAELIRLEAILQSCGGDSTKLSAALNKAGIDGEAAVTRLSTAMATLKNELQTAGTEGTVSLRRIIETYTQMQTLLNNNPQMADTPQFAALSTQVEVFRSIIEACGGDATKLEASLHNVGLSGANAIENAKTAMASFKAEVASTASEEEREAAAAKKAAEAKRQQDADDKAAALTLKSYSAAVVQGEAALRNWTAAERSKNASSREAYQRLKDSVASMKAAKVAYDNGSGSIDDLRIKTEAYKTTLKESEQTIKANGDATKSLSDRLGGLAKKFGAWLSVSQVIMLAVRAVRQMVKASVELDSAMTQMQIVTKASTREMEAFADAAAKVAKRTASTITDVVDSATVFARLGYSMNESTQLAEFTAMLQNVGDIDVSDAQDAITSIVKAYDIDASQIESIMDKLVEVGNHFPISVSQIAEGMTNASSTLHAAGNSFEQSVALLTAANTTIQDAAKSSTGLRTIAARIRNTKTELDDLGEVMTEANYEELVQTLTDSGVALTNINGEYRSTYDIMSDIAAKWDEMDNMRQAALATALSGTRQQAIFYSIIENFQEASGAMESMTDSAGALSEAYDTYLNSAQAHIDQFKASFQALSANIVDSDLIKWVVDFGAGILDLVNNIVKVVDKLGGLKTVLYSVASVLIIAKAAWIAHSLAMLKTTGVQSLTKGLKNLVSGIRAVIDYIPNAITAWRAYTHGVVSANTAMQASIPAIGLLLAAVTALIAGLSLYNNSVSETREKNIDAAKSAGDTSNEIASLTHEFLQLNSAVDKDESLTQKLIDVRDKLIDKLGLERGQVSGLTDDYKALNEEIIKSSINELKDNEIELRGGLNDAEQKALDTVKKYRSGYWSGANTVEVVASISGDSSKESNEAMEKLYAAGEALEKAGYVIAEDSTYATAKRRGWGMTSGIALEFTGDISNPEGIQGIIGQLKEAMEIVEKTAGSKSILYQNLYNAYKTLTDGTEDYFSITKSLNTNLAEQYVLQGLIGKEIPGTKKEFDDYRKSVIGAAVASGEFVGSTSDIEDAIDDVLSSQPEFADFYKTPENTTNLYKAKLAPLTDVLTALKTAYNLAATAEKEMEKGEGLSADTIKSLAAAEENYLDYLYEENGVVKLNTKAWRENANSKMNSEMSKIREEIGALQDENKALQEQADEYLKIWESTGDRWAFDAWARLTNEIAKNDNAISSNQDLLRLYSSLYDDITGDIDAYSSALDGLTDTISELKSKYDILSKAEAEMADNNGLSIDTIIALSKETDDFIDFLYEENGAIKLNIDAWKEYSNLKITSKIQETEEELAALKDEERTYKRLIALGNEYNEKVNGNVDFNSRPYIAPEELREAGWTNLPTRPTATYTQNYLRDEVLPGSGEFKYAIAVTPILEDGTVLSPETLTEYVDSLINQYGAENILKYDYKKLIIDVEEGVYTADDGSLKKYGEDLAEIENEHYELAQSVDLVSDKFGTDLTNAVEKNSEAIEKNEKALDVYKAFYDSITGGEKDIATYADAINNYENVADVISTVTDKLQTLADIQEAVADGFTLSADKAKELADVYPEILDKATIAANGEITLNEGVVNDFIRGKQAEITADVDAEIEKLKHSKAVLEGKRAFAEAQLDIAEQVGDGEGQISREVAEYRLAAGNALTEALIDLGIDESDAFALAAAAMVGDEQEFDRIATQCFKDLDKNSRDAAYNMARAIFTNSGNSAKSIADIAKQAHETAKAINAMGNGISKGKDTSVFNGADGVNTIGSGKFITTYGNFNGSEYTFNRQTLSLDKFTSNLKLDIDGYNKTISQIEGQIALLESIKNKPLSRFFKGTGGTGDKGSGKDSSKVIDEYIADIDEYYKALKRLESIGLRLDDVQAKIDNAENTGEKLLLMKRVIDIYEDEGDALEDLNSLRKKSISDGVKQLEQLGFIVSYNAESNEFVIENLEHLNELEAETAGEYGSVQEATNALREDTEEFIDTLEDLNKSNQEGVDSMRQLKKDTIEAKQAIVDFLRDIVEEASNVVDTYQNLYEILHSAADEFAKNGYITIDTLQSIIGLGANYMQYLIDENGMLVINHERIDAILKAKTEELALEEALTYVERLRLAMQKDSVEDLNNLLYASVDATDATWGLVYANLALLGLDDEQYQAALHNINAIRALSSSAISGIGRVSNEASSQLNEMKSGLDDILKYVMDMLKHRIQEQIDALNDMKTSYGELISLRKEALQTAKKEASYQSELEKKIRKIAKLQAQINALSLDDSRDAQAQRAKLEEELYELQNELADSQAEHAVEAQGESLDEMQKAYESEKDSEIKILEDSISSTQKLYDMAIDYIQNNWETLYDELINWNTEYGSVLNSEITSAWENCLLAAQKYGDYVSALSSIDADINAASGESHNDTVYQGESYGDEYSDEEAIHAIIKEMYANSVAWHDANDDERKRLSARNIELGAKLSDYGINAVRDKSGVWYVDGERLFEKYKKYIYHKGGIAGDNPSLKQSEILAVLEKGEAVLDEKKELGLYRLIDFVTNLSERFNKYLSGSLFWGALDGVKGRSPKVGILPPIKKEAPASVQFGDVYIYGSNAEAVEKHREVNRQFTNDIIKLLNLKR